MAGDESASDPAAGWEAVAALFTGLAHPIRVAVLDAVYRGEPVSSVVDDFDITRSGVQKHVDRLIAADLVYRPESDERTYALTPFGRLFAVFVDRHQDVLVEAMQRAEQAEQEARDEFADVPLGETALERAVQERKWDVVSEELAELLAAEFDELEEQDQ